MSTYLFSPRARGPMADSETYAHLEHLRHAGQADRLERDGGFEYLVDHKVGRRPEVPRPDPARRGLVVAYYGCTRERVTPTWIAPKSVRCWPSHVPTQNERRYGFVAVEETEVADDGRGGVGRSRAGDRRTRRDPRSR